MKLNQFFCWHNYNQTTKEYTGEALSVSFPPWPQSIKMTVRKKRFRFYQTCSKCGKKRNFQMEEEERKFEI